MIEIGPAATPLQWQPVRDMLDEVPDEVRPYRIWGYPVVPGLFLVGAAYLMINTLLATPGRPMGRLFGNPGSLTDGVLNMKWRAKSGSTMPPARTLRGMRRTVTTRETYDAVIHEVRVQKRLSQPIC